MRPIRERLSYGNVMATVALFVALGGTSYALSLPRDSVGRAQLRAGSVGRSEIRRGAVLSPEIKNGSIRLRDVSQTAKQALEGQTGPAGPPGPTFSATISSLGTIVRGNATLSAPNGAGQRVVGFRRSMASCVPVATLTSAAGGPNPVAPASAYIHAELGSQGRVIVRTWNSMGSPTDYPFNLVVAC